MTTAKQRRISDKEKASEIRRKFRNSGDRDLEDLSFFLLDASLVKLCELVREEKGR
jgi:hypothetical protein